MIDNERYNTGPGMDWDEWFHLMCQTVSKKSQCLSRHIGAILTKDNSILSTGYNGPPRGLPHCSYRHSFDPALMEAYIKKGLSQSDIEKMTKTICPRRILGYKSGEGLDLCVAGHAEENAILNAARAGIQTKGCKLYMDCQIPCKNCLIKIINSGIEEIIVTGFKFYDRSAEYILKNSNLKYRIYNHLKDNDNDSEY